MRRSGREDGVPIRAELVMWMRRHLEGPWFDEGSGADRRQIPEPADSRASYDPASFQPDQLGGEKSHLVGGEEGIHGGHLVERPALHLQRPGARDGDRQALLRARDRDVERSCRSGIRCRPGGCRCSTSCD